MSVRAARELRIDGDLTVQCAAEYKGVLLGALEAGPAIDLDLSGVSEIDTAGLQLLLLLKREAQHLGKPMRLLLPSAVVLEVLALARLDLQLDSISVPSPVVDQKGGSW